MKGAKSEEVHRRRIQRVLNGARKIPDAEGRIRWVSGRFVGLPYTQAPLTGSSESPEIFTASVDGFDCVTYMETVLALASARTVSDFISRLKCIRYDGGRVGWRFRNHYMTHWIRNNIRNGYLRRVGLDMPSRSKERVLNVVAGLPPVKQRFNCIPKRALSKSSSNV